jgi:hypothetical protein
VQEKVNWIIIRSNQNAGKQIDEVFNQLFQKAQNFSSNAQSDECDYNEVALNLLSQKPVEYKPCITRIIPSSEFLSNAQSDEYDKEVEE